MSELGVFVPNFSWVRAGELAGSGQPARDQWPLAPQAYAAIRAEGVDTVVSLLERAPPVDVIEAAGLRSVHFPIGDLGTPRDVDAFGSLVDSVHARASAGHPALVHCWAGVGRCGMFLATYLTRHGGLAPDAAVREVRRLRPGSLETFDQVAVVHALGRSGGA